MRPVTYKSILLPLIAAALVLINTSRVFGYINQAYPDSVTMTAAIGSSADSYVIISDGQDTTSKLPKGTVYLYFLSGTDLTLESDSIIQFLGYAYVHIHYAPTGNFSSYGTLKIVGDTNTIYVSITGNPLSHSDIQIDIPSYDSLHAGQETCEAFRVYNTNPDSIQITQIILTDDPQPGVQWSLANTPTLPLSVAGHSYWSAGQLCALTTISDSMIEGSMEIDYTYNGVTYSATVQLEGRRWPVSAECVTAPKTGFGAVVEGGSATQSITLTNTTDSTVYLDSAGIVGADYGQFTINSPTFPLTIAQGSSVSVSFTFTVPSPATKDYYSAYFESYVYGTSQDGLPCDPLGIELSGSVSIPVVDTIILDVPPGSNTLSITAHTSKSRHAIEIVNADTVPLLLESLTISQSDSVAFFGIEGNEVAGLFDTLAVNATSNPIILTLEAPDTGTYDVDLTLAFEAQGTQQRKQITSNPSFNYTVVAHRLPPVSAGVSEALPQVSDFSLSPNPASGDVTITLPQDGNSTVEIYDILGNLMLRKQAVGQYIWSGDTRSGVVATGAYIVRVTEREADGTFAVSSKRLIFQR